MLILTIVLHSWLLFSMAFFGISKITGAQHQVDLFDSIKLPQGFRVVTGYVQLIGCVGLISGYWFSGIAAWTCVWIGIVMVFACISHLRVRHSIGKMIPALLNLAISIALIILNADEFAHPFG